MYSVEQAARFSAFHSKAGITAAEARFESRLSPLEATAKHQEKLEDADASVTQARTWPLFNENVTPIADVVEAAKQSGRDISLSLAYLHVVVPKLMQTREALAKEIRAEIVAEMQGTGNNDTDPSRSAPSPSQKRDDDKSLQELIEEGMAGAGAP